MPLLARAALALFLASTAMAQYALACDECGPPAAVSATGPAADHALDGGADDGCPGDRDCPDCDDCGSGCAACPCCGAPSLHAPRLGIAPPAVSFSSPLPLALVSGAWRHTGDVFQPPRA